MGIKLSKLVVGVLLLAALGSSQTVFPPNNGGAPTPPFVGGCQLGGSTPANCAPAYTNVTSGATTTATAISATQDTFNVSQLAAPITSFVINSASNPERIIIRIQQSAIGVLSGTYTSGITATGSATQTCILTASNGSGTSAAFTVALTGSNTIAGGAALAVTTAGSGYNTAPTAATVASGTATCSGTAVISTLVAGPYTVASPSGFPTIPVSQAASTFTTSTFIWNAGAAFPDDSPATTMLWSQGNEVAGPAYPPASGTQFCWNDSTSHTAECEDSSGHIYQMLNLGAAYSWTGQQTLTAPILGAATATSLLATGIVDGVAPITITTGTTGNLGSTYNTGYTLNHEGTAGTGVTYTLPATATGKQYCVKNSGTTSVVNTGVLTVYPASGSYVILNGVVNTVGGGGTHGVASGGAAGDGACFVAIDSTHWEVFVGSGVWTEN